jgi:hypothetical protein
MTSTRLQPDGVRGKLSAAAKTFVVQQLAMFESPAVVRRDLKADFGVEISDNAVRGYDPTGPKGRQLSPRWRMLFEETRKAFLDDVAQIGIAHKAVRLRRLERAYWLAERQGNTDAVLRILEQAAKEEGGLFTNARVIKGAVEVTAPKSLAEFYGRPAAAPATLSDGDFAEGPLQ